MKWKDSLNIRQVQSLLVHNPLVIVRLKHSPHTKKLIGIALRNLSKDPKAMEQFINTRIFLRDVAPRYALSKNQNGARSFLLREIETILAQAQPRKKKWTSLSSSHKL